MATERKVVLRYTIRNQDWVRYDDGHYSCIRYGEFVAGVSVRIRGATERLADVKGTVTAIVSTWCGGVTIAVNWQTPTGMRLTPCWPAARLEIVSQVVTG